MNFNDCHLIEPIVRALTEQGYDHPTPIQQGAIPPALAGRDVLGLAQTGTGKTCAFAAPILQRLHQRPVPGHPIRALVLTPTRELAIQNQQCFEAYSRYLNLTSVVIFGGVGQAPQVEAIRKGADILIATPGRLEDLHQQGFVQLDELELFVLDEADRMLDMGFLHDVRKILKWLPQKKQTLFFSATMPQEITDLVSSLLHDPVRVAVTPVNTTVEAIEQTVYQVDRTNKTKLLVELLKDERLSSVLVFTRTKHGANKVCKELTKAGLSAAAIHGNKSQTARQEALAGFKAGDIRVLVATDIAARGLDIEDLACVVNYNLPEVPETYIHRIGRTGRAGRLGVAIALCDYAELPLLKDIEHLMKKTVPVIEEHPYPMENFEELKKDKHGKVRNPEDEEARTAAREKAKARKADQQEQAQPAPKKEKSGAKKRKKQGEPENGGGKAAQSPPAPEKTEKKGKKSGKKKPLTPQEPNAPAGVVPIPDLLPKREEKPAEPEQKFDTKDILTRKYKRPEKKVIPSLASVSLLPTIELKETFGNNATGLEFRPENLPPSSPLPTRAPSGKKEKSAKPNKAAADQPVKQEPPQQPKSKAPKKPKKKPSAKPNPKHAPKPEKKAEKKPEKAPKAEQRVVFTVADKEKPLKPDRKAKASRRPDRKPRQKDSDEQKSLMKPYYLSDRRKG